MRIDTKLKLYKIVLDFNVQSRYYVKAKSLKDAQQKARRVGSKSTYNDWEYRGITESEEVESV